MFNNFWGYPCEISEVQYIKELNICLVKCLEESRHLFFLHQLDALLVEIELKATKKKTYTS